jgi:hypothetical protein
MKLDVLLTGVEGVESSPMDAAEAADMFLPFEEPENRLSCRWGVPQSSLDSTSNMALQGGEYG